MSWREEETPKSDFDIVGDSPNQIVIRDQNRGRMSVTNDAERVVAQLLRTGRLSEGKRLLYYDSDDRLDEILFDTTRGFIDFKPLPQEAR